MDPSDSSSRWLCAQKERIMRILAVFRRKKTVSARIGESERETIKKKKGRADTGGGGGS